MTKNIKEGKLPIRKFASVLLAATVMTPVAVHAQAQQSDYTLEEVVVTAQRREEKLKDVPIAITAVTGEQLEEAGIENSLQLTTVTPGLNFVVQGAYVQPTIRGIGTTVTGAGADANVALYIDGVYQPSQAANAFDFNNIERIEVLKGPQGTLFGRNATGGAISVTTLTPSFDPRAEISVGYGSFNQFKSSGYATMPLTDMVAADLAFTYKHDDGFVRNVLLEKDTAQAESFGIRSKWLFRPTDNTDIILAGGLSRGSDNSVYVTRPINRNNAALRTNPNLYIPSDIRETNTDTNPIADSTTKFVNLTARHSWDVGTVTSITSYSDINATLYLDSDVTSIAASSNMTHLPQKTWSQEVNYTSTLDGPLNFITGVYFYKDDAGRHTTNTRGDGGTVTNDFEVKVKTDAAAVYGEVNYDITDAIRLIGGVRYSTEHKSAKGANTVGTGSIDAEERWNAWTPRASIRWALSERANVYATYSRGFKSGSFNTSALNQADPVEPEFVDAYEIGWKYARPRLTSNLSAFHYDYTDIQVGVQTNIGGVSQGVLQNAASARIYGVEGDLTALLSENWKIRLGAAYTDAKYEEFTNALLTTPRAGGGNTQAPGDASGNDMIRSPELMANGTLTYTRPLSSGELDASVTVSYNSGSYWDPGNRVKQDAYTLVNSRLAWTSSDNKYRAELWGTNLTDEEYYYYVSVSSTGDSGSYQRPRSVGVTLTRYFD